MEVIDIQGEIIEINEDVKINSNKKLENEKACRQESMYAKLLENGTKSLLTRIA